MADAQYLAVDVAKSNARGRTVFSDIQVPFLAAISATEAARDLAELRATAAETARTAAETARTAAETARTAAETARAGAETARAGAETARAGAEAARDSAVNSFVGTDIQSGVSADSLTSPGVYRGLPGRVNLAAGFPVASGAGVLEVLHVGTGSVVQRFTVQADAGTGRGHYLRTRYGGNWQPWRYVASQRVDQTAGRVIYTWDDLNGREQLVYGDTGWRVVGHLLINGWSMARSDNLLIRRVGSVVFMRALGLVRANATAEAFLDVFTGFGAGVMWQSWPEENSAVILREQNAKWQMGNYPNARGTAYATFTWVTDQTWPNVLPGTAFGAIPS